MTKSFEKTMESGEKAITDICLEGDREYELRTGMYMLTRTGFHAGTLADCVGSDTV